MRVLEFRQIPPYEKEFFQSQFEEYLEEIDRLVGNPVDPDFHHRYPDYDLFFIDNFEKQPFRIFAFNPELPPGIEPPLEIGFFFLNVITPAQFPSEIPSIIPLNQKVASLTDFYIKVEYRNQGLAWVFYESIIRFIIENGWEGCWECDVRNRPAMIFYDKVLDRIEKDFPYMLSKYNYVKPGPPSHTFCFYQVKISGE
jgi:GNAT superfamily N-acetyltransferase